MKLKGIGALCLSLGIVMLIVGILLFMYTTVNFIAWVILGSVVLNVAGITMLTHKTKS